MNDDNKPNLPRWSIQGVERFSVGRLTTRRSGRAMYKMPSARDGVRGAQLNR
jgi:hypothetical protein